MFRVLLLLLAVAVLHAKPLHRFPNGRLKQIGPQMVQDEHRDNSVLKDTGVKPKKQIPVPVQFGRQGTEPSRRILMDLNTGMLKEEVGEINRRVFGFYNPPPYEMRKGTQNSQATLVDPKTGQILPSLNEQQRNTAPSAKREVVSGPEHEDIKSHNSSEHKENHIAVPVESRRQGTEPSRRFLMDLNIGMLIHEVGEMNRRVSGFYNPPPYELRRGTQNSHATLVDPRTGQMLLSVNELQRSTAPLDEFRQGTEYHPYILQELRVTAMQKPANEPSRNLLMDLNPGLLKEHQNKMDRRPGSKWEVVSGPEHEDIKSQDSSEHKENHIAVPVESRRQGTEPSRRFLMDLNIGMLIHEVGEMNRRVSGFYNPPPYELRRGTQNSHATLVDPRTGQMLLSVNELQRSTAPLDDFRQGTEYHPYILQELRLTAMQKPANKPSRNLLMDLNPGLLKEHQNKMDRRPGSAKWQVVSGPEHEDIKSQDSSEHKENHIAVPVESHRQGTEPSRRFLMDLNIGMLIHEVGEMNRRVSDFYNPPPYELRRGTQNSHATLVDPRTGQMLLSVNELQRSTAPLDEFRQGTEYHPYILQELRVTAMQKPANKPSRNLLMDLNPGLLKEHQNKMDRRPGSAKREVVSGPEHEDIKSQDSSEHKENHIAVPVESRRQGTEPSRRFLMDLNIGMLIHEVGEMNRRVSGFYNPPPYELRRGTQNSHATLVDPRTGQMLLSVNELQRSTAPLDEFRQGTEYHPYILQELRLHHMIKPALV